MPAGWILLFGVDVSFYLQHPEQLYVVPGETGLSNRMRERLALAIFTQIGSSFVSGRAPWTLNQLANQMAVPMHVIDSVLGALQQADLLKPTGDDPSGVSAGTGSGNYSGQHGAVDSTQGRRRGLFESGCLARYRSQWICSLHEWRMQPSRPCRE